VEKQLNLLNDIVLASVIQKNFATILTQLNNLDIIIFLFLFSLETPEGVWLQTLLFL
jgi:hypothetical protein